jgi:GT2 family glycosyltransferase
MYPDPETAQQVSALQNVRPGSYAAPSVTIIILNWNGRDDTIACIESLQRLDYPNFDLIVVDNGSTDESVPAILQCFPDLEIVQTGRNLGFAEGNNVGIRIALERGVDYVFLLNNDTVVHPSLVSELVSAAERCPEGGIFGAKIFYYADPTRVWYAGVTWDPRGMDFHHVVDETHLAADARGVVQIPYACGCALLAKTAMLRKVGLLDPAFFLTFEETDLCFRAGYAGYACYYVPSAVLWHKISVSFGGPQSPLAYYFVIRNRLLWGERHLELRELLRLYRVVWRQLVPKLQLFGIGGPVRRLYWYGAALVDRWRDPGYRAMMWGAFHYIIRRFGDAPARVRTSARRAKAASPQTKSL